MMKATIDWENEISQTLQHIESIKFPEQSKCDLDFEDDIVFLIEIEKARKLLQSVQKECRCLGLQLNAKK